ncbi:receptor-type tyrosine-protein phosphatase C-like [Podarcis raffonei]|uniref:receptor-type tyrosine-protein phosphatase C-like n=1 Tax=Podarcis raffonei TaxID=65483 RepID=UPI0023293132|nr:receptor-type tyrosine-protein phosphatase C-like [Podarcis raffonei]
MVQTSDLEYPANRRTISVARYKYNSEGVTAELAVMKRAELQNVSCENAHCTWDKDQSTLAGLQECDEYKIVASFNGCDDFTLSVHVPPETDKWKLEEPKKSNTSVTLSWNNREYDKHRCHLRYYCRCLPHGKNFRTTEEQNGCIVTGLSPNKNYSCKSEISFNGKNVKTGNKQLTTDYGKPTPVRELQVDPLNQEISAVKIKCREPEQINGPQEEYHLYFLGAETMIKANESCYFEVINLCHSTTYQFKVIFYNGKYSSDPVISDPVRRGHYENYGPQNMTMNVAEQTEPLTGSQMCTSIRSPDKSIEHREENELNVASLPIFAQGYKQSQCQK